MHNRRHCRRTCIRCSTTLHTQPFCATLSAFAIYTGCSAAGALALQKPYLNRREHCFSWLLLFCLYMFVHNLTSFCVRAVSTVLANPSVLIDRSHLYACLKPSSKCAWILTTPVFFKSFSPIWPFGDHRNKHFLSISSPFR